MLADYVVFALLNLILINVLVGVAVGMAFWRLRSASLLFACVAVSLEVARHFLGMFLEPGTPHPAKSPYVLFALGLVSLGSAAALVQAYSNVLGTIRIGRLFASAASLTNKFVGAVAVLYVLFTGYSFVGFDPTSKVSWYLAFLPVILCQTYLFYIAIRIFRADEPAAWLLAAMAAYLLAMRLALPFWVNDPDGIVYALMYYMDSFGFALANGVLLATSVESLHFRFETSQSKQRDAEEDLKFILDNTPDAVVTFNENLVVYNWNQRAKDLVGFDADEVIGKMSFYDFTDERGRRSIDDALALVPESQQLGMNFNYREDFSVRKKDGSMIPVEVSARIVRGEKRQLFTLILRDVERQRAFEKERQVFEDHLQHAQKLESLGVLAGGVAHDFNNLLTGVMGNAELAAAETKEDGTRSFLNNIVHIAKRASDLTSQLLTYSGAGTYRPERVNLVEIIKSSESLITSAVSKNFVLSFDFEDESCFIHAEETQMVQVLMNLVTNASDALLDSSGFVRISCGKEQLSEEAIGNCVLGSENVAGDYVFLRVRDNGMGMSTEVLSRVFDPFFSTKFTGRGLGMATVAAIIQRHDGSVRIDSQLDQGTTFTVYLPAIA